MPLNEKQITELNAILCIKEYEKVEVNLLRFIAQVDSFNVLTRDKLKLWVYQIDKEDTPKDKEQCMLNVVREILHHCCLDKDNKDQLLRSLQKNQDNIEYSSRFLFLKKTIHVEHLYNEIIDFTHKMKHHDLSEQEELRTERKKLLKKLLQFSPEQLAMLDKLMLDNFGGKTDQDQYSNYCGLITEVLDVQRKKTKLSELDRSLSPALPTVINKLYNDFICCAGKVNFDDLSILEQAELLKFEPDYLSLLDKLMKNKCGENDDQYSKYCGLISEVMFLQKENDDFSRLNRASSPGAVTFINPEMTGGEAASLEQKGDNKPGSP